MRISDWSSDVCSSDLVAQRIGAEQRGVGFGAEDIDERAGVERVDMLGIERQAGAREPVGDPRVGDAQAPDRDRESVVYGKSVSVRVDLGGRRIIKNKNLIYHSSE